VTVYQGQLDLICCTLGADAWMAKLRWRGMRDFRSAERRPFYADGPPSGEDGTLQAAAKGAVEAAELQGGEAAGLRQLQRESATATLGRQPRQTAGFVREHGPLALVTVMSAGELLAHCWQNNLPGLIRQLSGARLAVWTMHCCRVSSVHYLWCNHKQLHSVAHEN